jgi:endonuclease/exonuclease/phosphatase family metal-dependent hydrolase
VSRLYLVAAVAAAVLTVPCRASASAEVVLRAMTYNVHWAEGTSAATGKRTGLVEPARVVRDIRSSGAEVVALQEAQSYLLPGGRPFSEPREIARALGWTKGGVGRHYLFRGGAPVAKWCKSQVDGRAVVRRIGGLRARCVRHGDALLSRRPLAHKRSFSLWRPDGDDSDGDALGTSEGRVLVGARIRVAGASLWLWTTHFAREPDIAACQLAGALAPIDGDDPALLLADFNMSSQTLTAPRCAEAPARPFDLLDAHGFHEPAPVPPTYPAHAPAEAIDHVLASGGPSVSSTRALRTCRSTKRGGPRICSSDHLPLLARVKLAPS